MKIINHMIISSLEFSWVDADLPSFIFFEKLFENYSWQ